MRNDEDYEELIELTERTSSAQLFHNAARDLKVDEGTRILQ